MSAKELTGKIRELKELQIMADELQEQITILQGAIKEEMTAQNVEVLLVDIYKVRWTTVISNRFDTKTFKSEHSDLYARYTKSTESRRFSVA